MAPKKLLKIKNLGEFVHFKQKGFNYKDSQPSGLLFLPHHQNITYIITPQYV